MTTISDLSEDLVGEILSWVPFTSLISVRSTCRKWNALSKNHIFGRKTASMNQFLEFMIIDSRVCSLRLDLQGIRKKDDEDFIDPSMKPISIPNNHQVEISQVYHCDGLLLCITKDNSRLFVWNPYLGQTKWIQPRYKFHKYDSQRSTSPHLKLANQRSPCHSYSIHQSTSNNPPRQLHLLLSCNTLGYDNNHNYKILRFLYGEENNESGRRTHIDIYDFSSDSWRVLDVNPDWYIPVYHSGVSLKGNTYFFGQEVTQARKVTDIETCLLCFDFTTERFGPHLPLLFHPPCPSFETVTLSWVRDEKLAVLYNQYVTSEIIEIRISTKIEPNAVSWSSFLTLDMSLVNGLRDDFSMFFEANSFFIDEEKKVVVLFDSKVIETCRYQMAYIVGDDGYFKSVNIGVISNSQRKPGKLVCSSYVPSLVQLQD